MIYIDPNYFRNNQVQFGDQIWFSFKDKFFKFQIGDEKFGIGYLKSLEGDIKEFFYRLGLKTKSDIFDFYSQCLGYPPEKTIDGIPLIKYGDVIGMTKVIYELLRVQTLNTCFEDMNEYIKIDNYWENVQTNLIN